MGAKRVVHVVGTGTLGEPVISLLLHLRHELEVDEITFHKNRPLLNDRMKILSLMRRGAKLTVEEEKMADFEKLGMLPTYTRQAALEQATVVIDCTAEGLGSSTNASGTSACPRPVGLSPRAASLALARCMRMASTMQPWCAMRTAFCKWSVVTPITWQS